MNIIQRLKKTRRCSAMKALIDADPIVWAVGCVVKEDPLENALHSVKMMLNNILDKTECDDHQLFLTGERNFRKEVHESYKANRKQERPHWYNEIRQYMIDHWGAEVVDEVEADDALGLNANDSTILVSIDKDLDQIPGMHYNYNKDSAYYVNSEEGDRFFWTQMLTGDRADNIAGIAGIGPVKAGRILDGLTSEACRCEVGVQYAIHFDDPEEMYERNAKLLWILR